MRWIISFSEYINWLIFRITFEFFQNFHTILKIPFFLNYKIYNCETAGWITRKVPNYYDKSCYNPKFVTFDKFFLKLKIIKKKLKKFIWILKSERIR